ncbi:hypothetical protein N7468_000906 [Penicillium chermesinum]|uniref:STAS domain-containing protein n=1 Tax=Penicillium chermesinum TaxID=63820 RepID=A0A9W9PHT3_9EURO|nr:uncharacterized protein N7468_000906 [Penicillium chermesinum]KAJ5245923.1 hypothetical protein N7468_000906 [Penicillium chermesinum]
MGEQSTKVGHALAKGLGIKLAYRDPLASNKPEKAEEAFSVANHLGMDPGGYPSGRQVLNYLIGLFPFLNWIRRYNVQWLMGDLVAGITVGAVVVPQGMAYAELAELPVQYGLYSSFMGVLIYWFFATSKDITIGPVAVMSTLTGSIILDAQKSNPKFDSVEGKIDIANCLAVILGGIVCALGFLKLGFLVDFIPLPAISAFMTGSAVNIIAGQVPTMLGEKAKFSTRGATYKVIINTLKHLPSAGLDAAMGVTACAMLYIIRFACTYAAKKQPHRAKLWFFISTLRTVFVILFYTMISAACNIHRRDHPMFKVLGHVPRGFQHAAVPVVNAEIIKTFLPQLPVGVIVLLIEHIAISKSFGRVNNYTIDPSQEFIAIGITNLLGPFLGAYPATGSFSRTAIKSKAGVRTPLAGCITAIVVLLAIYALPAMFWYIPKASLAGVIIHAVGDLITSPNTVYQFWRVAPLDVIIFFIGVIVTVFTSIEDGIYCTICVSAAVLLFRVAKARGQFLGRVKIHSVIGDHLVDSDGKYGSLADRKQAPLNDDHQQRAIFLPVNHQDGSNPDIEVEQPHPGIFIYRFSEGFNYPNANHYTDYLVDAIFKQTRRTNPQAYARPGDRPWNDPGPSGKEIAKATEDTRPTLQAVILDFSSVNNVDTTSIQTLIDVRNQLDRYAAPRSVQWHFAHINNRWTKRGLAAAGFGFPTPAPGADGFHRWKPIFSVAEIEGNSSAAEFAERENNRRLQGFSGDLEAGIKEHDTTEREIKTPESSSDDAHVFTEDKLKQDLADSRPYQGGRRRVAIVQGMNRPFFHIDLTSALQSAIANCVEDDLHTE